MTAETNKPGSSANEAGNVDPTLDAHAAGQAEAEAAVEGELVDMESALGEAEQEVAKQKDAMLRMHAEMENLRKRLIRDHEKSRKRALEQFMNDLLPVRDSLVRGLEVAGDDVSVQSLREGKELTLKMLGKVMSDHGLIEIDPLGETFDPELHEAMSMLPSPDYPANTVMNVIQKGYQLNERLIRPAMVVVSRGSE